MATNDELTQAPTKASAAELEHGHRESKFQLSRQGGDIALQLFENVDEVLQSIDPEEERRIIRKIDWRLLPYMAVCYAFFFASASCPPTRLIFLTKTMSITDRQDNSILCRHL